MSICMFFARASLVDSLVIPYVLTKWSLIVFIPLLSL